MTDWIINNLIDDLAEFLNISKEEAIKRLDVNWYAHHHGFVKNRDDRKKWMIESHYYLYDSIRYQLHGGWREPTLYPSNKHSICDFGAGIGSHGFWMATNGYEIVTLVDTMTINCEFMKFRAKKYGLKNIIVKQYLDGSERFDFVFIKDTIAYLVTPIETMIQIINCMNKDAILNVCGWGNVYDTNAGELRGNKEMDFHQLFLDLGLNKINDQIWIKKPMKILVVGKSLANVLATASYYFYRKLLKQADCIFYGDEFHLEVDLNAGDLSKTGNDIEKMAEIEKPDIIWIQWFFPNEPEGRWKNINKIKNVPKIGMAGDPWSNLKAKVEFNRKYCSCVILDSGLPNCQVWNGNWKDFPSTLFHAGVNTKVFRDLNIPRIYDIGVFGSNSQTYYPVRNSIRAILKEQNHIKSFIPEIGSGELASVDGYVRAINKCKMVICTGEMYGVTGKRIDLLTHKYLESMACNSMVLGPLPIDSPELHFEDGYNIVSIDEQNVLQKIQYYIEHEDERLRIAKNGYETIQKWHTMERRAFQFIKLCQMLLKGEKIPEVMS